MKYDRQIVAIAIAKQCTAIYSTDGSVRKLAAAFGMTAHTITDLPEPPPKQELMFPEDNVIEIDKPKPSAGASEPASA